MLPHRLLLLIFVLVLGLAACGDDNDGTVDAGAGSDADSDLPADGDADGSGAAASGGTRPWIGGEWDLVSMTVDGAAITIPPTASVNLSITGPDQVTGDAGCNSFGGTISAPFDGDRDGGPLMLGEVAITEMGCDILDFESQYVDALVATTEWELAPPSGLVFRGDGVELVYGIAAPPAEVAFENTEWLFDTIFDGEGVERTASSTRGDKPPVTAVFAAGQATLTSDDCGTVTIGVRYDADTDAGAISFDKTDPGCTDPESNMIPAVRGLVDATGFQIFDGRLTFIGLPGETVSFIAADG
ncbi:MAG: META domain-containing protein [Actinomycetota bacterium]